MGSPIIFQHFPLISLVFVGFPQGFPRVSPGYNFAFGLFGGFAPLLAEASLDWAPYGPGLLLSLAGLVTVVTILGSVHLLESGKVSWKKTNWYYLRFVGCFIGC